MQTEQHIHVGPDQVELNLLGILHSLVRGRWILLGTTILGLVIALITVHVLKPYYIATATFLPPRYTDLAGSPSAQLLGGGSDASDLYLGLLSSASVLDDVIDHAGLKAVFHSPTYAESRYLLMKHTTFGVGSNAIVVVSERSPDPVLAAKIANGFTEALYRLNGQMVASSSSARQIFFKQQLDESREALTKSEFALEQIQEKTGLVLPGGEAQANLNATAGLQAQVNGAEERLSGLLVSETEQNPEVVTARAQLSQLRGQLARAQQDTGNSPGIPSANRLPGLTLEIDEKDRKVKQDEASYEGLLQQYSRARLASIDPGPQLEIIDRAKAPEFPAGPDRRKIEEWGAGLGLLAGLLYVLFFEPLRRLLVTVMRGPERKADTARV